MPQILQALPDLGLSFVGVPGEMLRVPLWIKKKTGISTFAESKNSVIWHILQA